MTPDSDWASNLRRAFSSLTRLLDTEKWTYFRVDYRDRDQNPETYDYLASLMDLRLIHLLSASVSFSHDVGAKAEAYLLDLSQYSGDRLRKNLHVLDFERGSLVLKSPGEPVKTGNTARRLVEILRRGPIVPLSALEKSSA